MTMPMLESEKEHLEPATERPKPGVVAPFFFAVQFLTVLPPVIRRTFSPGEIGWSLVFFPVVGGLVGAILVGLDHLTTRFPPNVSAALVLTGWVLLTGALHLDGFLDSCDGLLGGQTAEERLHIMRDERVGAYAVIGGILLILMKFSTLLAIPDRVVALLIAPVLGRWSIVLAVIAFPYARVEGLGRDLKDHAGWTQAALASAIALPFVFWAASWRGIIAAAVVLIVAVFGGWLVIRRLSGLTGDIYGAGCEISEVLVLLTLAAGEQA